MQQMSAKLVIANNTATEFLTLLAFGTNVRHSDEHECDGGTTTGGATVHFHLQQQHNHKHCEASFRLNLYWHILDISALVIPYSYLPYFHLYSHFYLLCTYLPCIYHTLIYSHFYLLYLACRFCTATLTVLHLPPPVYLPCMHTASLNVRLLLPN